MRKNEVARLTDAAATAMDPKPFLASFGVLLVLGATMEALLGYHDLLLPLLSWLR